MIPKFSVTERGGREVTRRDGDTQDWDRVVSLVLGPAGSDLNRALADALALHDAAERAVDAFEKRIRE